MIKSEKAAYKLGIKIGIVGFGKMGMLHGALANGIEGVSLTAISEKSKIVGIAFKAVKKGIRIFSDYKKMLDRCVLDGIIITTPTFSHLEVADYAVKKGIALFIEKPMTKNYEDAQKLLCLVSQQKILSSIGFHYRFIPAMQKSYSLLKENSIGKIKHVEARFYSGDILSESSGWRFNPAISGGGVLIDFGIHLIDVLQWFFGKIETVKASSKKIHSKLVEDEFEAVIKFKNGIQCDFVTSWSKPDYRKPFPSIIITGEAGSINITDQTVEIDRTGEQKIVFSEPDLYKGAYLDIGGIAYSLQMEAFINAIRQNKECESDIRNACYISKVIDTLYYSAEQNRELRVED